MQKYDYIKRDFSWLSFNHRVLQEANDKRVPLYERIKFLAIYSSNLDEFFRVRVASLRSFKELKKKTRKALDIKPKKELKQIHKIVQKQQEAFGQIFRKEILPELAAKGIHLIDESQYNESQKQFAKKYFFEKIYPHVTPLYIEGEEAPFLKNKGLYFIVQIADTETLALVEIPTDVLPRFINLPNGAAGHAITFIDDIIRFNLSELLNKDIVDAFTVKLSRDAEMYIDDEYSGDLLQKIKKGLDKRSVGLPTRFLFDAEMSEELRARIKMLFGLSKDDMIPGARYHNFNDFFAFPDPTNDPNLHNEPLPPLPHPVLEAADSIIQAVREQDFLLHFPYQKYDYIPQLIQEASEDPAVKTIKITLYRVASKSAVVDALLNALKNGKKVTVFIEAKARFDEASNLYWGEQLEKANGKILYSYPGIKVHTKLLLIGREEEDKIKYYSYLGTGNFNEKTARLYCDHALLTANQKIGKDVSQVFDILTRKIIIPKSKLLFIAPFTLRENFEGLIDQEIANAKAGKEAYMILKMNSLEDTDMMNKLYEASQAGVKIQMIVRGICCLIPGVDGMSENIKIISIVDRFLEHARVYIFGNDGKEVMYTASADWMNRNLDHRIEVAMPILDEKLYQELRHIVELQLSDNVKARIINTSQSNPYKNSQAGKPDVRAQVAIYNWLAEKE